VARTEGYARAARAFPYPITEPGVHQQVKRLEGELGMLPAWLRRLQRRRSDIEVALTELKTPDTGLLRSGELDLLVDHVPEVQADIEVRTVARLWSFLVLPSGHPLAGRRPLPIRALRDVPFIAYNADRAGRALQLRGLATHGGPEKERYSADSAESLLGFVAAGLGFSIVPWLDPHGPRRAGVVAERLRVPGTEFPVHAAWRRGPHHPLVDAALAAAPDVERG
jgi:DNA-binding transcriptional LysR family regulator